MPPQGKRKFFGETQPRNVMYKKNVTLAIQKWLNRSSCIRRDNRKRFKLCIRWAWTFAPPGKYSWTIVCGSHEWVCQQG